jgi:nucleoside-diphosphate-sugar epimerase
MSFSNGNPTMKVLFIGGTGFISTAVSRLALARGLELFHLNRGRRGVSVLGAQTIVADIHEPDQARQALEPHQFDVVVDWIAYTPADVERDLALFSGRVKQFIFISSASAYQKPPSHPVITESTPLHNPYWAYSQNKIACELRLMQAYRAEGFPVTIVRPSLTYDTNFPIAIGGWDSYTLVDRLKTGRPIIVHGDGASLWVVTHSDDFARGFVGLLGHTQAIGHAFHITSDEILTWNQIYATIAGAAGVEPNLVHIPAGFIARHAPELGAGLLGDKAWSVIFDNTKIKTFVPGFQAVIPFREGIRRTLAWYEADPRRCRIDQSVNAEMDTILRAYQHAP